MGGWRGGGVEARPSARKLGADVHFLPIHESAAISNHRFNVVSVVLLCLCALVCWGGAIAEQDGYGVCKMGTSRLAV